MGAGGPDDGAGGGAAIPGPEPHRDAHLHLAGIAPGRPAHLWGWSEVLAWCLALESERRFGSMLELRQALLSVDPSPPLEREWGEAA